MPKEPDRPRIQGDVPWTQGTRREVDESKIPIPSGEDIASRGKDYARTVLRDSVMRIAEGENPEGRKVVRDAAGGLVVDRQAVDTAEEELIAKFSSGLRAAIEKGSEGAAEREKMLWWARQEGTPEAEELIASIEEAARTGDSSGVKLDSLHIALPTRAMAERRVVAAALQEQIKRMPFGFKDGSGKVIDFDPTKPGQSPLDIVLVKDGDDYKLVIACKDGVRSILAPMDAENLPADKFRYPSPENWTKSDDGQVILVPIENSGDGEEPLFSFIEIRKQSVDLIKVLAEEEDEINTQRRAPASPPYRPVPPSVPSRPSPRSQPAPRPSSYVAVASSG